MRTYSRAQQDAARRVGDLLPDMNGPNNFFADRLSARQDFEPTVLDEQERPADRSSDDQVHDGDHLDGSDSIFLRG